MFALPLWAAAQEVCNNGIDDDSDGLIDLNDPDCPCATLISPNSTPSFIPNPSFEQRTCCPYSYSNELQPYFSECAVAWDQATEATSDYYHECGFYPPTFPVPPPDGVAFLGMITTVGSWIEYVGTNLTMPPDPHPLLAGTTYTLSLWVALLAATGGPTGGVGSVDMASYGVVYHDPFPLAIYGHNTAVPFPVGTYLCIGDMAGWSELGRVYHTPNGLWEHVFITFTPSQEIDAIIIGA
ncbi:MAG TPA: hypothetical protein VHL57_06100, partial [Flavobacteriales bacterium]|nr:hypothetical protein [Flavobacteriales bacterium]